jgi:two-component system CheB/CheR fusion protein
LQTIALLEGLLKQTVTDPRASSIIDQLGKSLKTMSGMLDTLLEINQLEAGIVKPVIEDFAIGDLLGRLHAELGYHAEAKGLTLHVVRNGGIVRSDPKLLEHIVRNLLSNAIKYTQQGKILLGCRRRGAALCIDVLDTGIGIPDDQVEAIFEEFHQIDNPARDRRHGLGLGLSIVQRLSTLLAHPVKVHSVLGKGSAFSVEVPRGGGPQAELGRELPSGALGTSV